MGKGSVSSKFLALFNIIYTLLGVAIIGVSIWFFLKLTSITSLRNHHHFQLDNDIYAIQVLPWMLTTAGVFILLVSGCAFFGILMKSRVLVWTNVVFQLLTILLLAATAFVALQYAASEQTDNFIKVSITDAFQFLDIAKEPKVNQAFQDMERDLQCCGSSGPSSYNGIKEWEHNLPPSCCEDFGDESRVCHKTDAIANTRNGCIDVAIHHIRIAAKIFAGVAVFTALIGILNIVTALLLTHGLGNWKKTMKAKLEYSEDQSHKTHVTMTEMETLKMPLKV